MKTEATYHDVKFASWSADRPSIKIIYHRRAQRWFYHVVTGGPTPMHYRETGSGYVTREDAFHQACVVLDNFETNSL